DSTYLGGTSIEAGNGIAVNAAGNAYVAGRTVSTDFPTANPIQSKYGGGTFDAFVAKLNASGAALHYSTYVGGNSEDDGNGIVVDAAGSAYIAGLTASTDFPTENPLQSHKVGSSDAVVAKLNASGSALIYSTYLGGSSSDFAFGIAVDAAGNAYIAGQTASTDFPTANAGQGNSAGNGDAFVTKLNASGSALIYSTYLGGSGVDDANHIAVDSSGNAYVTGFTFSTDFPTANAIQNNKAGSVTNAYVTKLNASGSALLYSTYLGGSGSQGDDGNGIAVDAAGNAYVTGFTTSTDFPIV